MNIKVKENFGNSHHRGESEEAYSFKAFNVEEGASSLNNTIDLPNINSWNIVMNNSNFESIF